MFALYVWRAPAITLGSTIYVNPNATYGGGAAYQENYAAPGTLKLPPFFGQVAKLKKSGDNLLSEDGRE
jgi:hypothetical protein